MLSAQNSTQQQIQHFQQQLQYQKQQQQQLEAFRLQPPPPPFDDFDDTLSLSSSPNSAQLSPAVFSAGFDPDFSLDQDDYSFSILGSSASGSGSSDLNMQTEPWLQQQQQQHSQTSVAATPGRSLGRFTSHHHRESSLSSLGSASAGPASPFSQNTSNPHIAVTDPTGDGYPNMSAYYEDATNNYQLSKPLAAAAAEAAGSHDAFYPSMGHVQAQQAQAHFGGLLSTPGRPGNDRVVGPGTGAGAGLLSQPVSVASSIASNSPATPSLDQLQPDEEVRRRNGEKTSYSCAYAGSDGMLSALSTPEDYSFLLAPSDDDDECSLFFPDAGNPATAFPKYDPYHNDDLQSSSYGIPTSAPHPPGSGPAAASAAASPVQDMFSQRLQTLNNQHLRHSSVLAGAGRERSPFRQGSPLAPSPLQDFGSPSGLRYATRPQQQSQQSQQAQQQQQQQQHAQTSQPGAPRHAHPHQLATSQASNAPQTISPKDAVLEYHDVDAEADPSSFSLFAQTNPHASSMAGTYPGMAAPSFGFLPQMTQMTQPPAYPYVAQPTPSQPQPQPQSTSSMSSMSTTTTTTQGAVPATLASPAGPPRILTTEVPMNRPFGIAADGGTYTCTYHGCTLRFETPALLQKHKREGHRQAHALAGSRRGMTTTGVVEGVVPGGATSALLLQNSQAGPHRCERINPSTGKPCNTVFSRPYDLTRHEDTIHNARKQKVRCALCTEEKTFSRADALTRHFRVCHPDVELRGKQRKRMTSA